MGSVINQGPGSGPGGYRPGAGRKPVKMTPRAIRDRKRYAKRVAEERGGTATPGIPAEEVPAEYAEILPPKEAARIKRERTENFRRFARDFVLENIAPLSEEILAHGTRSERASLLNWMSQQAYGLPSKTPINLDPEGKNVLDLLQDIADKRTAEQKLLAPPETPNTEPEPS